MIGRRHRPDATPTPTLAPPATTLVGVRDATWPARVDRAGQVSTAAGWTLGWWIGADDRWRLPFEEAAVRQSRATPLDALETLLRVPSGDIAASVWAAQAGVTEVVAVDFDNRSPLPVVLALVLSPGAGAWQLDGQVLRLDGVPALVLPRAPARVAVADTAAELAAVVTGGGASEQLTGVLGRGHVALLTPLVHRSVLRVTLPNGAVVPGGDVADPEAVARGWRVQLDAGTRLSLPDRALETAVDGVRAALLIDTCSSPAALAAFGHHHAAADRLGTLFADPDADLASLAKDLADAARYVRCTGEVAVAEALVATAADVAAQLERAARRGRAERAALRWPAEIVAQAGQPEAAAELLRRAGPGAWARTSVPVSELVPALAGDPRAGLLAVRDLLVDDPPGGPLGLLGPVADGWLGQAIEVHGLPTAAGTVDYAVRWHGARPALLWEVQPRPGVIAPSITIPGLADGWSSEELRSETLLPPPHRDVAPLPDGSFS